MLGGSGLSRAEMRAELHRMQDGRCAGCGSDGRLVADHDHDTGLLRGLLCRSCNAREGKARWSLSGISDPAIDAYLAAPPAAAKGWMWDLPDWWRQPDTIEVRKRGITVLEYVTLRLAEREAA